jgi:hypothetical protein
MKAPQNCRLWRAQPVGTTHSALSAKENGKTGVEEEKKNVYMSVVDVWKGTLSGVGKPAPVVPTPPSTAADMGGEGYPLIGTLTRSGPVPLFYRVFLSGQYEAAVNKFMLMEKCSRVEAMANMDYYFQNPNDWLAMRMQYEKTGKKVDIVNANQDPKSLALVAIWGTGITLLLGRMAYGAVILYG